ncbi:alpha/beta hydrolase [Sphingobacterium chuzhouense]|uniref:Alpha/beta hydrolase n=1 Tax=Sphingobacterium chuzhouense TaxID=1742264 RepID=A0ABR7XVY2_9SPHI|nr:alpha/beta hydrolase [Sphingobacterium chuzhouense]MBD1423219.1 alpha/beta hydrolase [Sphingobacterium chuzhouense]
MKFIYSILFVVLLNYYTLAQEKVALYAEIPNATKSAEDLEEENIPVLYKYELPSAKQAVLVIPGGGYSHVAINHEGHEIAKAFNEEGYSAFVLYYRLPKDEYMEIRKIGPLQDAQRGMQYIREHYDFDKIGVIGFSAGGHLASSLSNHFDDVKIENQHAIDLAPDFSVLVYPVISMDDEITHKGSKKNLIGEQPHSDDLLYFSLEKQVSTKTPPTFLVHAEDDKAVPVANALRYKEALDRVGVINDMFIYNTGGHGFGLHNKTDARKWSEVMFTWLKDLK